ncbi:MAG: two-component sensor histidine kinase, partial [Caulobacteraceae bacterium]|nr:two-component sensor histidine kinase [Caulobacteraceae bacterium]
MRRWPPTPLFIQALGLVIATLVAAQVATLLVIFSLPPPTPEIYTVGEVVQAIGSRGPTPTRSGRALVVRLESDPPSPAVESYRRLAFRGAVARALGVAPARIVVARSGVRFIGFTAPARLSGGGVAAPEEPLLFGGFELGVRRPDGRWLVVRPKAAFGIDPWQQRLLLVFAIAALAVSPLAWWFARRLAAPIAA